MNMQKLTTINLQELNKESTVTENVKQEYIVTTYDKVKLILIECEDNKKMATEWWSYLGMALSFLFPCFTAEFKSFLFFSADIIKAIFIIMSLVFGVVTIFSIYKRIRNRNKLSIEYCVDKIKNSNTN